MYTNSKQTKTQKNNLLRSRTLLVLLSVFLLAGGILFALEKSGVTNFYQRSPSQSAVTQPENTINYDPPTENEVQAGNEQKQAIIQNEPQQPTEPAQEVTVTIVDANQYGDEIEVRAFVPSIVRNGTCSFTFTNPSGMVEKSGPASADASSTLCISQVIPRSEFSSAGQWDLTVRYLSDNETITGIANTVVEVK